MRLFSWNVNGVRAIEKKGFLDWVDNTSPDILCIQETKANFDQLPDCLLYTSPSPRDGLLSRMPSSA